MFWCRNSVVSQFGLNKAHLSHPSKVLQESNPGASTYSKRAVEAELQSTGNNRQARPIGQNPLGFGGAGDAGRLVLTLRWSRGKKNKQNKMTGVNQNLGGTGAQQRGRATAAGRRQVNAGEKKPFFFPRTFLESVTRGIN